MGFSTIFSMISFPTVWNSWTFTSSLVTTPVTMFLSDGSRENGLKVLSLSSVISFHPGSCWFSLLLTGRIDKITEFLHGVVVLRCYGCGHCPPRTHFFHSIPIPWVKPPLLFNDRIKVCSMTRSELSPAQKSLLRRITWNPLENLTQTSGCLVSSWHISWT